jgi:hypothetical protein
VANPRQVFNLAAVCVLSGTDFAAYVAHTRLARSKMSASQYEALP